MEHSTGVEKYLRPSQIYETTISDDESQLSAHFLTVPSRSLGGASYLFRGAEGPLETLGLTPVADVPLGGVVRSLAACLVSENFEEFSQRFFGNLEEEIEQPSVRPPSHFAFAEYLTFARVVPFGGPPPSADSLGNILTFQSEGYAAYVRYEGTQTVPMLGIAIRAGMVVCGPAPKLTRELDAGLRDSVLQLVKSRPGEERHADRDR